jgi:hypothetical protein
MDLDFRHIVEQGLSSEEGVDLGSFVTMLTIHCYQSGEEVVALDIFNILFLPTTSVSF